MSTTWTTRDGHALWNGRELASWSTLLADELAELFDPAEIWLFGSVARGDDHVDSDLDVMVVLDRYDPNDALELKQLAVASVKIPAPFDVVFSDAERMVERGRVAGTIERAVALDGRLVYRRE